MKLSIIIPVYNERSTIEEVLSCVKRSPLEKEIIIVDDYSTDGTRGVLQTLNDIAVKVFFHSRNRGKGAAVRTGIEAATGDIIIIQDADLEYNPEEYQILIEPIVHNKADAVYGSRFLGKHRVFLFWHYLGNKFLTFLTNILYDTMLTDMETCYKAVKADVMKSLHLRSDRFDIEPEITAKLFKKKYRVFEVPISYSGRDYREGKKITWKDGVIALWTLLKYRFTD
ncbi:MAG: glycosyltransferase family 2 protein [Acidobacteriota bacterium]